MCLEFFGKLREQFIFSKPPNCPDEGNSPKRNSSNFALYLVSSVLVFWEFFLSGLVGKNGKISDAIIQFDKHFLRKYNTYSKADSSEF